MHEEELAKFLSESPLENFISLEIRREALYEKFLAIDELHKISERWLNEVCAKSAETLSLIASLSILTYQRFKDELTKTPSSKLAGDRKKKLQLRIESLAAFEFEAAILMRLYSDMINKGILGFEGQPFSAYYLTALNHITRILEIFFDMNIPTPRSLGTVASAMFKLEQKRRLVGLFELDVLNSDFEKEHKEFITLEKGEFSKSQGEMKHRFLHEFLRKAGEFWWWLDPIAMKFNLDRAEKHLQDCVLLWEEIPGEVGRDSARIKHTEIPAVRAKAKLAQAIHYYRLGMTAAEQDSHNVAAGYFQEVLRLCDAAQKLQKKLDLRLFPPELARSTQALKIETRKLRNKAFLLKGLANLSKHFGVLTNKLSEDKFSAKEILEICDLMLGEAESLIGAADVRYLSSLPLMFTTLIEALKRRVESTKELQDDNFSKSIQIEIQAILTNNMRKIERGIQSAYQSWEDQYVLDPDLLIDEMKSIKEHTETLYEAVVVLPMLLPKRKELIAQVKIIGNLSISTTIYHKSLIVTEENVVLDLLLKAKSHYYAREALKILDSIVLDEPFVEEEVRKQVSRSLVAGYNAEMAMFSLLAQWWHFNRSGPALAQVYNRDIPWKQLSTADQEAFIADAEKDLQSCNTFLEMLRRIQTDCQALLTHRLMFGEIVEGVLWDVIERRVNMVVGVIKFLESIQKATIADLSIRIGAINPARTYFTQAQDLAFAASESFNQIIGIKNLPQVSELPENVFSFGQFCQHAIVGLGNETERIPLQGLLDLFRKTLFSI